MRRASHLLSFLLLFHLALSHISDKSLLVGLEHRISMADLGRSWIP